MNQNYIPDTINMGAGVLKSVIVGGLEKVVKVDLTVFMKIWGHAPKDLL
jgi:hypothetical protein